MKTGKIKFSYNYNNRFLGPLEEKHLPFLKAWRNVQMEILRQHAPLTDLHQKTWYSHLKEDKSQSFFSLMFGTPKKMELIGYCGITNIDFKNRRGEISFLVNPLRSKQKEIYKYDFRAVLSMLCKYGFEELNLNKMFTETFDFRKEHIKIIENFGFKREGNLREHCFRNGKYFNSLIHSILLSEWNTLKDKKYGMEK